MRNFASVNIYIYIYIYILTSRLRFRSSLECILDIGYGCLEFYLEHGICGEIYSSCLYFVLASQTAK